jgi:hypothetical protein
MGWGHKICRHDGRKRWFVDTIRRCITVTIDRAPLNKPLWFPRPYYTRWAVSFRKFLWGDWVPAAVSTGIWANVNCREVTKKCGTPGWLHFHCKTVIYSEDGPMKFLRKVRNRQTSRRDIPEGTWSSSSRIAKFRFESFDTLTITNSECSWDTLGHSPVWISDRTAAPGGWNRRTLLTKLPEPSRWWRLKQKQKRL